MTENKIELKIGSFAYLYLFNKSFRVEKIKLLEDRYVEFENGISTPFEDCGDCYLTDEKLDVYVAFEKWCDGVEKD